MVCTGVTITVYVAALSTKNQTSTGTGLGFDCKRQNVIILFDRMYTYPLVNLNHIYSTNKVAHDDTGPGPPY